MFMHEKKKNCFVFLYKFLYKYFFFIFRLAPSLKVSRTDIGKIKEIAGLYTYKYTLIVQTRIRCLPTTSWSKKATYG